MPNVYHKNNKIACIFDWPEHLNDRDQMRIACVNVILVALEMEPRQLWSTYKWHKSILLLIIERMCRPTRGIFETPCY